MLATSNHTYVRRIVVSGLSVAASVVLCRFFGFSPEFSAIRFEIGFLPILLTAHLYGSIYGGFAYLAADIIGGILAGHELNYFISACKFAIGFLMGVFFRRKKITLVRTAIGFTIIAVLVEFLCMAMIFRFYYTYPPQAAYTMRALTAFANLPLRIFLSYGLGKFLTGTRGKIVYE